MTILQGVAQATDDPGPGEFGSRFHEPDAEHSGSTYGIPSPGRVRGQPDEPDSVKFTASFWFRLPANFETGGSFLKFVIAGRNAGVGTWGVSWSTSSGIIFSVGISGVSVTSNDLAALAGDGLWHHVIASGDSGLNQYGLYVDGVNEEASNGGAGGTITWEFPDNNADVHGFGGQIFTSASFAFFGDLSEVYLDPQNSLDLTSAPNRERFRSAGGLAVDLGKFGTLGTGFTPAIYSPIGDPAQNVGRWGPFRLSEGQPIADPVTSDQDQAPVILLNGPNA